MSVQNRARLGAGLFVGLAVGVLTSAHAAPARAETLTVTFESAPVRDVSLGNRYWWENGGFVTQGVGFSGRAFGGFVASRSAELSGWGYFYLPSSPTTAEISAYANPPSGGGADGSPTFAVASGGSSTINLPAGGSVRSVRATNTATAFYSLRDGDQFAKPFGKVFDENIGENGAWVDAGVPDWFKVAFTGYAGADRTGGVTGQVDFYLADYRFPDPGSDYIIEDWTSVDLAALGNARSIGLAFSSSDNGIYGMNTPSSVALDDLVVSVPEPSALAIAAGGAIVLVAAGRRRRPRVP